MLLHRNKEEFVKIVNVTSRYRCRHCRKRLLRIYAVKVNKNV